MGTLRVLTIGLVALLLVSCAVLGGSGPEQRAEFETLTARVNTPEKVDNWLGSNFSYDFRKYALFRSGMYTPAECYSQLVNYPIETFYKKEGVCIDAANFAAYCLKKAGYKVRAPLVRRHGKGHMVCAVKLNDGWWMVGNTRIFEPDGSWKSYKDLLSAIQHGKPEEG